MNMNRKEAIRVLEACFRALPARDRKRLLWHVENGTPIVCSNTIWTDGSGGG